MDCWWNSAIENQGVAVDIVLFKVLKRFDSYRQGAPHRPGENRARETVYSEQVRWS